MAMARSPAALQCPRGGALPTLCCILISSLPPWSSSAVSSLCGSGSEGTRPGSHRRALIALRLGPRLLVQSPGPFPFCRLNNPVRPGQCSPPSPRSLTPTPLPAASERVCLTGELEHSAPGEVLLRAPAVRPAAVPASVSAAAAVSPLCRWGPWRPGTSHDPKLPSSQLLSQPGTGPKGTWSTGPRR